MLHWDGVELADSGWITIYGAWNGQAGGAACVPLAYRAGPIRARINDEHVDSIAIHRLEARKQGGLNEGQAFRT